MHFDLLAGKTEVRSEEVEEHQLLGAHSVATNDEVAERVRVGIPRFNEEVALAQSHMGFT